ncbi:tubulin monoglycylase TTLL3-like isoform X2 [Chiroxiphia lanceolata]|uniref:tubulin monoglycylase TTLL3-like isoform X2 n=1 Tax=Chiroxiphia lanceolata TaxID=296741 RepID=UPI0013CEDFC4|nr:tubulin monoglycylase TTLL3-like isoform X2 [Chiroxiphia lanceolata]
MEQCSTESSTAGTQPPSQGQRWSRGHPSSPRAQQAGDKGTVGRPGAVQCTRGTGAKPGRSDNAMSGAPGSARQRQAGQRPLPHSAPPRAGDTGPVSSDGAVLTRLASATTTSHQDGHQCWLDLELLKKAKLHVETAIKEKKIFMVQGPYPTIRRLLRARGWVERKPPRVGRQLEQHRGNQQKQQLETEAREDGEEQGEAVLNPRGGAQPTLEITELLHSPWPPTEEEEEEEEQCDEDPSGIHDLMSYLVRDRVPNFIWANYLSAVDPQLLEQDHVVNHYARVGAFTTKEGLCLSLQNLPWIEQADPNTFFPRCYRLGTTDEREAFIDDFRLTAARSLLKLALEEAGDRLMGTEQPPSSDKGPGPGSPLYPQLVEEALEVCEQHLGVLGHQDIDRGTPFPCRTCIDWDRFLQDYYCVAHEGAGLVLSGAQRERCQDLLRRLAEQLPQFSMEGKLNVWILKPGAESQGRGIVCATRLEEVLRLARGCTAPSVQEGKWVVQKYLERLLTIFGTKFDIRQWFVVTDWKPLTVWFYGDCYLRFCSRPFSLHCLERARHLCNVSVQKWYKTSPDQDPRVPSDRVWSSKQFQAYLAWLGQADAWHQVIVPGMKAAILSALRSAQDQVGFRKNSFELYGADFLVGEDCQPWLLEINSCPTMSPSSAVTRRLCANVQRDTLRLVLDRKDNPTCSIGAFELIYKEAAMPRPLSGRVKLIVKGCSLKKCWSAQHQAQVKPPATVPSATQHPVPPRARDTQVPQQAQHQPPTTVPSAPRLPVSPGARDTPVPKRAQHQPPTTMASAPKLPMSPGAKDTPVPKQAQHQCPTTVPSAPRLPVSPRARDTHVPKRAQHRCPTIVPSAPRLPVSPRARDTHVPKRAQHRCPTTVPSAPRLPVSPRARDTHVPKRAQHQLPTTVPSAPKLPISPGARDTHVPKRAQHRCPTIVPSAPRLPVSPRARDTRMPQQARHQPPTTVLSAPKLPMPPGARDTQVPKPRAATGKLPPPWQWCGPSSGPSALPQPWSCSAGSQGLSCLCHPHRQPQAAQPLINVCPLDRVPMPLPWGAPSNPWLALGCVPSFPPARPPHLPLPAQIIGTPSPEQKHMAVPNGTQKCVLGY